MSATLGVDKGWLAVGIHDAGTVTDVVPMPATAMKCKDIVQISSTTLKGLHDKKKKQKIIFFKKIKKLKKCFKIVMLKITDCHSTKRLK